jgi:hypothetical protein
MTYIGLISLFNDHLSALAIRLAKPGGMTYKAYIQGGELNLIMVTI